MMWTAYLPTNARNWAFLIQLLVVIIASGCQPVIACEDEPCHVDTAAREVVISVARSKSVIYAFMDINVIPMEQEGVLEHQTVLVEDGYILAIGPAGQFEVPRDATVIPGAGYYLMPGLADMHLHLRDESYLELLLANGVTSVRNMDGRPQHLSWRKEIARGERVGPRIFTTGPIQDQLPSHLPDDRSIETVDGASRIVREQKALGYDAIKVYDGLSPSAYKNLANAAHAEDLHVVGHIPDGVSIFNAIEAGQRSIEHLDGYFSVYPDQLPALISATVEHEVWNTPTLIMLQRFERVDEGHETAVSETQQAILRHLPDSALRTWWLPADFDEVGYEYCPANRKDLEIVHRLHVAGAPLLLGTDAPLPCALPGWAVHQELQNLVAAGLTPYEALRTATVNPALFLDTIDHAGTVSVGKVADLLVLAENPLVDVTNSHEIIGVMAQGKWWPKSALNELVVTQP